MHGWDCFGLYRFVLAEQFGIMLPSYADEYPTAKDAASVRAAIVRHRPAAVAAGAEREGDGVVFNVGRYLHCGYVIEPGMMLHAFFGRNTCMEAYTGPLWIKRIEGFYRCKS